MTNEDRIVALFAKANPVPSLVLLDPVEPLDIERLEHLYERNSVMTEVETIQPKKEERRLRPRLAIGVAATLIAVVALGLLINREAGVASPESVAAAFIDAVNAHDRSAVTELLASDVDVDVADFEAWGHDQAIGWVFLSQGCEERPSGPNGTLVDCSTLVETDMTQALELDPGTGTYTILVDEGQVHGAFFTMEDGRGVGHAWEIFKLWMLDNHPDDISTMYDDVGAPYTPEAVALWEQYTDEWLASLEG